MSRSSVAALLVTLFLTSPLVHAGTTLVDAKSLYQSGQYFKAARYAFAAGEENPKDQAEAYSWITISLVRAGLYNSASYFFIRTLQSGNRTAIRRVLVNTQDLLVRVGGDLLRKYLIRHTNYEDYDQINRGSYLYSLGKTALLEGQEEKAIGYFNAISSDSQIWPYVLQLRASANALRGKLNDALRDFQQCEKKASLYVVSFNSDSDMSGRDKLRIKQRDREIEDLGARCLAGQARVLYELGQFAEADRTYDQVNKASLVWPDILFEQAWNSFARQEYNRTLGKLVSYKSPALSFVFNTEVDVLRAQALLALCLYEDANEVINEFNTKYTKTGEEIKRFVERNSSNLVAFYNIGAEALKASLSTKNNFYHMLNRFVRGPYFQNLVSEYEAMSHELAAVRGFGSMQPGVDNSPGKGFPGFLQLVLNWRAKSIRLIGGAFVKNSLIDHHSMLIADFEKMAFIKLEMLGRAKDKLLDKRAGAIDRSRGNIEPSRRDDQYYWSFNGEFWNDELGDYVFGLESECNR